MTQRISKSGRVYTEGSQATFDGYPKTCSGCGEPVRITGRRALWFSSDAPDFTKRSWHADCYPRGVGRAGTGANGAAG